MKRTREKFLEYSKTIVNAESLGAVWGDEVRETLTDLMFKVTVEVIKKNDEYIKTILETFKKTHKLETDPSNWEKNIKELYIKEFTSHSKYQEWLKTEIELDISTIKKDDLKSSKYVIASIANLFGDLIV